MAKTSALRGINTPSFNANTSSNFDVNVKPTTIKPPSIPSPNIRPSNVDIPTPNRNKLDPEGNIDNGMETGNKPAGMSTVKKVAIGAVAVGGGLLALNVTSSYLDKREEQKVQQRIDEQCSQMTDPYEKARCAKDAREQVESSSGIFGFVRSTIGGAWSSIFGDMGFLVYIVIGVIAIFVIMKFTSD